MSTKIFEIEQLRSLSENVSSLKNLDNLLEIIINAVTRIMDVKASSLILIDEKTENLYFRVASGEKKNAIKKFDLKKGEGIAGFIAMTGEPVIIHDVAKDPRWNKTISTDLNFKTGSIAGVPLKLNEVTIGVIEIIDKINGIPFSHNDLNKLKKFAEIAAIAIGNTKRIARVKQENLELKEALGTKNRIIGKSKAIEKVVSEALKVANSNISTVILGESGTGKELLARLIHSACSRKNKHMVALNCAALTESLLEDELFGHEKGAFTGASGRKIGKFELADNGTIFLDEIGEMSAAMQSKLLRVLQEGVFCRVGGNATISVDVRVIAATNRDIEKEVREGRFREDLFYRLNVVQLCMPALRDRKEDIPLLVDYFANFFCRERGIKPITVPDKTIKKMLMYDWPGNIRELSNAMERAIVMGNGKTIFPEDLPIFTSSGKYPGLLLGLTLKEALNDFKKEFILLNLKDTNGVRGEAAKNMGIQRTYLSRLISKYKISDV